MPKRDTVSMVKPAIFMTTIVMSSENGIAMSTTSALRHDPKKNSITIAVRMMPSSKVRRTPSICWRV